MVKLAPDSCATAGEPSGAAIHPHRIERRVTAIAGKLLSSLIDFDFTLEFNVFNN